MKRHFPLHYSLDSGTKVDVAQVNDSTYEFTLTPEEGAPRHFTYVDGQKTKAQWDEELEFEELDALRAFWLKTEDII